jgi:hypothetical protein
MFAKDFGGAFRIVEKIRIADRFFEFTEAIFAFGDELGVVQLWVNAESGTRFSQ